MPVPGHLARPSATARIAESQLLMSLRRFTSKSIDRKRGTISVTRTVAFAVPRLAAFLGGLLLLLPWMATRLIAYTVALFGDFTKYAR